MSTRPDLVVLVRTLAPSAELDSTLELVAWIGATRPDLAVRVIAIHGGDRSAQAGATAAVTVIDDTIVGSGSRALLKVGVAPAAQAARSAGLRRELRVGTVPVLVDASAGGLLNWLDPRAERVVAHLHRLGPSLDDLPDQDRVALEARVTHWADAMDLVPQGADRDDASGVIGRCRSELDRDLGLAPGAPVVVMGAGPHDVLPPDALLALVWDLVGAHRGIRVLWVTGPLRPTAEALLGNHLADSGLHDVVLPVTSSPGLWRRVAGADAVVAHHDPSAAGGLGSLATCIAAPRTFRWGAANGPEVPDLEAIDAVLPGGGRWALPTEEWHAATGGPVWLELLGLDLPVA